MSKYPGPSRLTSRWPSREMVSDITSGSKRMQEQLTETLSPLELEEEIGRKLESVNMLVSKTAVVFNYVSGEFKPEVAASPVMRIFSQKSEAVLRTVAESMDLKDYVEYSETDVNVRKTTTAVQSLDIPRGQRESKVKNAFNFCEKESQTIAVLQRDSQAQTTAERIVNASGSVSLSEIYDAYVYDLKSKKERGITKRKLSIDNIELEKIVSNESEAFNLMEQALSQNIFYKVNADFRFYEDPADEYRSEGSLLPLWPFHLQGRVNSVTCLEWSKTAFDTFAASFGEYVWTEKQKKGAVAVFSIKCPLRPVYLRITPSPLLCVSMHCQNSSLLAVGQRDGHVAVYDSACKKPGPNFISNFKTKHMDGVFSIAWSNEEQLSFYSIGADGYVKNWRLSKLLMEDTVVRTISDPLQCGFRFKFHPTEKNVYLIGTVEGTVLKTNLFHTTGCTFSYNAHRLPIRAMSFNTFLPSIFLTCSYDGTIKMWQDERSDPLLTFDLDTVVMDCGWAPYTSTAFIAITFDGFAHCYDLNVNQFQAVCKQRIASSINCNRPMCQAFNQNHPIMLVGDWQGRITTYKLSPNLRVPAKSSKKETVDQRTLEIRKLEQVLSFLKPEVLKNTASEL